MQWIAVAVDDSSSSSDGKTIYLKKKQHKVLVYNLLVSQ